MKKQSFYNNIDLNKTKPWPHEIKMAESLAKAGHKIVFDSRRMKGLPDEAIMREVKTQAVFITEITDVIYINKHGKCIDIYRK